MNNNQKKFTGIKLEEVPLVLTSKEVSLILQVNEKEVLNLLSNGAIKTISGISELRIAAHSLFDFLHENENIENLSKTGFINSDKNFQTRSNAGFLWGKSINKGLVND